jgi:hypothetical protein
MDKLGTGLGVRQAQALVIAIDVAVPQFEDLVLAASGEDQQPQGRDRILAFDAERGTAANASPSRVSSADDRNRSIFLPGNFRMPIAGLSARSLRSMATPSIALIVVMHWSRASAR